MEDVVVKVLRDFGLKCIHIGKEKAVYVCQTDKGMKSLKKVNYNIENILFQNHVKEILHLNGFTDIDRFNLSVHGLSYVVYNGEAYVLADYMKGKEANFSMPSQIKEIVKKVAEMHFICRDIDYKKPAHINAVLPKQIYEKNISDLQKYKKMIHKQSQFSDFDVTFLKHYNFYTQCLDDWYEIAKKDSYGNLLEEARDRQFVCHNLLKEENILVNDKNKIYITNFSEITIDHFMKELSALIKRYIRCEPKELVPLEEIISIYDSQNPVGKDEISLLKAFLIFPDKFLKICSNYYAKRRTWIPGTFVSRMELITSNSSFQYKYFTEFFK